MTKEQPTSQGQTDDSNVEVPVRFDVHTLRQEARERVFTTTGDRLRREARQAKQED